MKVWLVTAESECCTSGRAGGKVLTRTVIVVEDWTEVT